MLRRRVMGAPFEVLPQTRSAPGDRTSPGGASFLPPVADYVVRGRRRHSRQPVCAYACRTCGDDIEALVATALAAPWTSAADSAIRPPYGYARASFAGCV